MAGQTDGETGRHRVVVVGGGFGGVQAVRKLRRAPVEVTLIDRRNFSLFQPLVYQVATGALSPGEIASPLRGIFKRDESVRVVLGEVTGFDLEHRRVLVDRLSNGGGPVEIPYDSLIVAGGSNYSYFGHDEWRPLAPDVKSLENALEVRRRILTAFEAAEYEADPDRRAAWLTFVVVGAGPTGVELAGQIAEIARDTLHRDFRTIDTRSARVLLVEMADRVLPQFPPRLSQRAARALEHLGVTPLTGHRVVEITAESVTLEAGSGTTEQAPARTVVWAAGVVASELAGLLGTQAGAAVDRAGRVAVRPDLTMPGHPEVIALGDMVQVHDAEGKAVPLPGLAPVAMQQGRYAGRAIRERLRGREPAPFHYRDKGNLATIGRAKAVADIKGLQLSGFIAWLTWLLVHLFYLIGFQNRLLVFTRWVISFVTRGRGERLITTEHLGGEAEVASGPVAYDEQLAERIRELLAAEPELTEKRMFGGLAFLVNGNMAVAASGQGGLLVRVDPAESATLVGETPARVMEMRGREMPGWLRLDSDELRTQDELSTWVQRGLAFGRSLPAKR